MPVRASTQLIRCVSLSKLLASGDTGVLLNELKIDIIVSIFQTFVFVKNLKEVERFSGADPSALEEMIKKHAPADTFTGSGYTLHSGSGVESTTSTSTTGSQGLGGWLGNLMGGGSGSGSSSTSATSDNEELNQKCEEQAREIFPVDKKVPTCKMQVRFLDGKK